MNEIEYLLLINRERRFFINHSRKDEKVILTNVSKDVANEHCHMLLAGGVLICSVSHVRFGVI